MLLGAAGDGGGSPGVDKRTSDGLGALAGSKDQGSAATQRTQLPAADFNGGNGTRHDSGGEPGLATNALGYGERLGNDGVKKRSGSASLPCLVPRIGEMDTDFGIARDEGIEARADTEDMSDGGVIDETIEVGPVRELEIAGTREEAKNRVGSLGGVVRPDIKLGTVGTRENDGLVNGI